MEVDNRYLKEVLGLGDFRPQSLEAIEKWFAVVNLALNYLQYCAMLTYHPKRPVFAVAHCKRLHQRAHTQAFLHALTAEVKRRPSQVDAIAHAFLPAERLAT